MGELAEGEKGQGVIDGIADLAGGVAERGDEVAVAPDFIGAGALLINETDAGIDVGDLGDPGFPEEGGELDLEPEHLTWENGVNLIAVGATHGHVGRGELGEIGGVGKEVPGGSCGDGEDLGLMKSV